MHNLTLTTDSDNSYTAVPDIFIDKYIPNANGEFVKVYLYLLRLLSNKNNNLSISSLADIFEQTESDIIRALRYWDKQGLLDLDFNGNGVICGITLKDLNNRSNNIISHVSSGTNNGYDMNISLKKNTDNIAETKAKPVAESNPIVKNNVIIRPSMIAPTKERLAQLNDEEDFSLLMFGIQSYLGRPLKQTESNLAAYLYDEFKFSSSLIDYLFSYCIQTGHTDIRYIEATALAWNEKNIKTIAEAKEETTNHSDVTVSVIKAFGLQGRDLATSEKEYIERWNNNYNFSPEIISEACNRTIIKTHEASFPYAESILKGWYEAGIKSLNDISKLDAEFNAKKASNYNNGSSSKVTSMTNKQASKNKTNKFNNFQQREYSQEFYDSLYDNM